MNNRRGFLEKLALGSAGLLSAPSLSQAQQLDIRSKEPLSVHVFSKHLQFLGYDDMASTAAEIGFDGVDLTVRPGGHVLPENVKSDLPKAVEAVRKQGLLATMMTTRLTDVDGQVNRDVLDVAADQGIKYFRTDYFRYPEQVDVKNYLNKCLSSLQKLATYAKKKKMYATYQNHAGSQYVGAPLWDIASSLYQINSPYMGCQYDIRHATVEGGLAWPTSLNYISPYINSLVMKDFRWEEHDGQWKVVNTPIGEGMVDFPAYFKQLRELNVSGPVSVHFEYPMPEEDNSLNETQKLEQTKLQMKADLDIVRGYIKQAGL